MTALGAIDPATVTAVGWTLVHFLWQGAAAAVLLAAVNILLRRSSPRARYAAALVTLLAMLALPVTTFLVVRDATSPGSDGGAVSLSPAAEVTATFVLDDPAAGAVAPPALPSRWLMPGLVAVWALGVLTLSLRTLGGWLVVMRLRRSGRPLAALQQQLEDLARRMRLSRPVRALSSALVEVPTAIGWLRPVILLPPATVLGLSPAQLELVLAHELAHIRRLDHVANMLQALAETLLFYHPLVWWVSGRLRLEREQCCDDVAVAACGDALAYARVLATVEELRAPAPRLALALTGGALGPRVRRLLAEASGPAGGARWPVAMLVVMLAALAVAGPAVLRAGDVRNPLDTGVEPPLPPDAPEPPQTPEPPETPERLPAARVPQPPLPPQPPQPLAPAQPPFPVEDAIELAQHGVTPEFAEEMAAAGFAGLTNQQLLQMRIHGVTPRFAEELREQGYAIDADQLVSLRVMGVTPGYSRALAESGLSGLSVTSLLQLRTHGVTAEYLRELKEMGLAGLSALDLVTLRTHGVRPDDVRALKELGLSHLTVPRLTGLRSMGVTARYVRELKDLGYGGLSVPVLIALRSHGVGPDYVRELQALGYSGIPAGALVELRSHGVTPGYIRELKEAGWTGLSTDELVRLRAEGFRPGAGWRRTDSKEGR
jgi:beta-lactamase regulating signal transducer with metallopeptidase domain